MTSYAAPERLLALGTAYTRHHDALAGLLHSGNRSACTLARHIPPTQALARDALEVPSLLRGLSLYHSPEVLSGLDRIMQLAALATTATDHLLDAADFLHDAPPGHEQCGEHDTLPPPGLVGGRAACRPGAPADCARRGRLSGHGRSPCPAAAPAEDHTPASVPPAVARGWVSIHHVDGKVWMRRGDTRVTISTVRALETRSLVTRETFPRPARQDRIDLTPNGCRALGCPHPTPRTIRPAALMAPNTLRVQSR